MVSTLVDELVSTQPLTPVSRVVIPTLIYTDKKSSQTLILNDKSTPGVTIHDRHMPCLWVLRSQRGRSARRCGPALREGVDRTAQQWGRGGGA
ncbi:hypothetical protein J6590_017867 [Homalodisca vitripennis]|nr:hypothetical protein J6590_017867 [Homalodisca vitripennis]